MTEAATLTPNAIKKEGDEAKNIVAAMLAEYAALRAEILFFIASRERLSTTLVIVFLAQLLAISSRIAQFDAMFVLAFTALAFPALVCVLMFRSMDYTAKVLQAAAYIDGDLRKRLIAYTSDAVIEWEAFKARNIRSLPKLLDFSKWWLFGACLLISWLYGSVHYLSIEGVTLAYAVVMSLSFALVVGTGIAIYRCQFVLNEYSGSRVKNPGGVEG